MRLHPIGKNIQKLKTTKIQHQLRTHQNASSKDHVNEDRELMEEPYCQFLQGNYDSDFQADGMDNVNYGSHKFQRRYLDLLVTDSINYLGQRRNNIKL